MRHENILNGEKLDINLFLFSIGKPPALNKLLLSPHLGWLPNTNQQLNCYYSSHEQSYTAPTYYGWAA